MGHLMLPKKGRKKLSNPLFLVWKLCAHTSGDLRRGRKQWILALMRAEAPVCIHFSTVSRESSGARRMSGIVYEREGWWKEGQMIMEVKKESGLLEDKVSRIIIPDFSVANF